MNETTQTSIDKLIVAIKADYRKWQECTKLGKENPEIRESMIEEFNDNLSYKVGKKYIKVLTGGSVWGFVVNTDEDKQFEYGDILKAASWNAPARNKPRGNVFGEYSIRWTGPNYL